MKKILLSYLQSCRKSVKDNFGLNSFFLLSFLIMSLSGFSQGPGDPSVDAGEDVILECGEDCTDLTASYIYTGESTDYSVSSIPFEPPFPFLGGTPVAVNIDDRWSNAIALPFDFCFYGELYTQMVIGSNAVVSFDLAQNSPDSFCQWSFSESIPNTNLFHTTIFGPYMDIHPATGDEGKINWTVFGESPYRTMVVNFANIKYYSCNSLFLTSQIVMYETTNVIEVYIQDRPGGCSWNDGNAIVGIQNQDGTIGETAPGRNTGNWSATDEAWRFTPNGAPNVEFSWLDSDGNVIGTETTINVCPTEDVTTYTAQAIYYNCNGDEIIVTDDVTVTKSDSFDVDLGGDQAFCDQDDYVITAVITDGDADDATFLWSTGETTQSITVTESGTYSVEVTLENCTITRSVTIDFYETPNIDLGEDMNTCFVNLVTLDASPSNYPDPMILTYEWTLNGTVISGETNPTLDITDPGTYGVTVSFEGCTATSEIIVGLGNVDIDLGPDIETCFDEPVLLNATPSNYDASDGIYEWTFNGSILTDESNATLYVTEIGTYGVTVTVGACSATDSIEILPMDDLEISIIEGDLEVCPNEPHTLTTTTSQEGGTYQWFLNGTAIPGETGSSLEFTILPDTMGTQTYSVVITVGGCSGTDSVDVRLYPISNCVISQGLSPNGDGYNDTLDLTFLNDRTGIKKLQIFNRLGTLVFDQNNYINEWAGKTNDGNDLPTGTYFYVIDLNGNDAVYGEQHTGWIYLNQKAN